MFEKVPKIESTAFVQLVDAFGGEDELILAAFKHSYFIDPDVVRKRTPYFPDRARKSNTHYSKKKVGKKAVWLKTGSEVTLDLNQRAQLAWEKYSGQKLYKKSGYSVRHIWGNPWDPVAYTAGWNLCYMPFWAGMLTEDQQPLKKLQQAVCQASWNLYFATNPVCEPPDFVADPGLKLQEILRGEKLLVLSGEKKTSKSNSVIEIVESLEDALILIRKLTNNSWSNFHKAVRSLQNKPHENFGTKNVENNSKSHIRRTLKTAGRELTQENLAELESLIEKRIRS